MNKELLDLVAALVKRNASYDSWFLAAAVAGIMLFGAFAAAYLKKLAELRVQHTLANTALDDLLEQTRKTGEINKAFSIELAAYTQNLKTNSVRVEELIKQQVSQENLIFQKRLEAVAELCRLVASGNHTISWLTWLAAHHPEKVTAADLAAYNKEMNETLQKTVGVRILVAAMSREAYQRLFTHVEKLYYMDKVVGDAATQFPEARDASIRALASLYQRSKELDDALVLDVIDLPSLQPTSGR